MLHKTGSIIGVSLRIFQIISSFLDKGRKFNVYIRRSEDVQNVFWMLYVGSIYILCPTGIFVVCYPENKSHYSHISKNFLSFHHSSFQKKSPGVLKNLLKFPGKNTWPVSKDFLRCFCKNSTKDSEKCLRGTPMNNGPYLFETLFGQLFPMFQSILLIYLKHTRADE